MAFQAIEPVSKRDRITSALRAAILHGELEPGALITETHLAKDFGVGQPLVREALIELEHAGFVQRIPYRGTYVTKFTREDIENIFRLRTELEGLAGAWAKERIMPDDIVALRTIVANMQTAAASMAMDDYYEQDLLFHRKIWQIAGNHYLSDALERVVSPLFAFFLMRTRRVRGMYESSAASHIRIVDALEREDAETVRRIMCETVAGFKEDWNVLLPE